MFTPQFLLLALAAFLLTIGLPALANPKKFRKAMKSFVSDENIVRLSGFISMIFAFFFLSVNWKFQNDWMVLISVIGWASFLKGIVLLWNPDFARKMAKKSSLFNTDTGVAILSIIMVVAAALLIYIGTEVITLGEIVSG